MSENSFVKKSKRSKRGAKSRSSRNPIDERKFVSSGFLRGDEIFLSKKFITIFKLIRSELARSRDNNQKLFLKKKKERKSTADV